MKIKISKIFFGTIITISSLCTPITSAFAAPNMYVFSGTITEKSGSWDLWDNYGFPSVSVGDRFVGSMFYSFKQTPNLILINGNYLIYDQDDFNFNTTINFEEFFIQANSLNWDANISSDRTGVGFNTGCCHNTSFYDSSNPTFDYFDIDNISLNFVFSESIPGNGFPDALNTSLSTGGHVNIGWILMEDDGSIYEFYLTGSLDYVSSVGGCIGDYNIDNDVDGLDLNRLIELIAGELIQPENEISYFAISFGKINCN